jgi:hypothetical protein
MAPSETATMRMAMMAVRMPINVSIAIFSYAGAGRCGAAGWVPPAPE